MRNFLAGLFSVTAVLFIPGRINAAEINELISQALTDLTSDLTSVNVSIKKVAVYAIEVPAGAEVDATALQDRVTTILMESGRFHVIDRKSLKALMTEQALSQTGAVEPAEMVKTGKLVGVEGFFFGSLDKSGDGIILNIRLIDVESSAVIYAKKYEVVSSDVNYLGFTLGYAGNLPGMDISVAAYTDPNTANAPFFEHEYPHHDMSAGFCVALSYKKGTQATPNLQFGADLGFALYGPGTEEIRTGERTDTINTTIYDYSIYNVFLGSFFQLSLKPKLYFPLKNHLGWKQNWLVPYIGAGLLITGFPESAGGRVTATDTSGTLIEDNRSSWVSSVGGPVFRVAPVFGADFNITRIISVFMEGTCIISTIKNVEDENIYGSDRNWYMTKNQSIGSGIILNTGIKIGWTF